MIDHADQQAIALLTSSVEQLMATCKSLLEASKINSDTIARLTERVSTLEERERYTGHE